MSRIWAALPLPDPLDPDAPAVPDAACWWRHKCPKNEDGYVLIVRTDSTSSLREARLGSWEWFDGLDCQLIFGVDVYQAHYCYTGTLGHLDVLALHPPTPSLGWTNLSEPGKGYRHDCHYSVPPTVFTGMPFPAAFTMQGRVAPE